MSADDYPFPGTILKALADIVIKFDEANFRKGETYFIKEIYGPVPPEEVLQGNLAARSSRSNTNAPVRWQKAKPAHVMKTWIRK